MQGEDGSTTSYFIELEGTGGTILKNSKFIRVRRSWLKRMRERKVSFALKLCSRGAE